MGVIRVELSGTFELNAHRTELLDAMLEVGIWVIIFGWGLGGEREVVSGNQGALPYLWGYVPAAITDSGEPFSNLFCRRFAKGRFFFLLLLNWKQIVRS